MGMVAVIVLLVLLFALQRVFVERDAVRRDLADAARELDAPVKEEVLAAGPYRTAARVTADPNECPLGILDGEVCMFPCVIRGPHGDMHRTADGRSFKARLVIRTDPGLPSRPRV